MKDDAIKHTDDDNNLEEEFKRWLPQNGVLSDVRKTYANDLNAIGGTGNNTNRFFNLVQELTGKKPLPVFSINDIGLLRENYGIVFLIKEWNGTSSEKLGEIMAKCKQTVSEEDIIKHWKMIKQVSIPGTKKKTSNGTLSAALSKYEEFLKERKTQFPGNPPATTASPNPLSELKDKNGPLPRNLIYFGAPGTGKSFKLKEAVEAKRDENGKPVEEDKNGTAIDYERVTFYPTYSYAQFVGCYKPVMKPADGGKEEIAYEFVPGPFLRVLVDALKYPAHNHCLVIEEINRANAAAVFGDVFQLLDRATEDSKDKRVKKGESEYDVAASEDVKRFLQEKFKDCSPSKDDGPEESKNRNPLNFLKVSFKKDDKENDTKEWDSCRLRIPSNMYIWATMNSADQGVFPMDTAFKRRWEFEYIPIDAGEDAAPAGKKKPTEWTIDGVTDAKGNAYNWNEVRKFVNSLLSLHGVNEDKLMGAHFVQAPDGVVSAKAFESKVLMYLWEDAGRMCRKDLFDDIATYSNLLKDWHGTDKVKAKGIKVFDRDKKREDLESELKDWYKNVTEAPSAD